MATKKAVAVKTETLTPSQRLDAIGIEAICEYVANGDSLRSWALLNNFTPLTVANWVNGDPVRSEHYARAREDRADLYFDQLDDVSELAVTAATPVEVAGLRLKADNMKWKLARMNAKKYGDKLQTEHSGEVTLFNLEQSKRMAALLHG